jgi:hypothetical protein
MLFTAFSEEHGSAYTSSMLSNVIYLQLMEKQGIQRFDFDKSALDLGLLE